MEIKKEEIPILKISILNSIADLELMNSEATREEKGKISNHLYHLENMLERIIRGDR